MWKHLMHWVRRGRRTEHRPGRGARSFGRTCARVHAPTRVEPTWLELTRHEVPIAGLTASFRGIRLVQLTDFHGSRKVTTSYLREAVELAQAQEPELVLLTGDFIHHGFKYIQSVARELGKLRAPHGVFAV